MKWLLFVLVAGCGSDIAPTMGAGPDSPPGTPLVEVTAPTRAQAFYITENIGVTWTVADDTPVVCDVTASAGSAPIEIMLDVAVAAGATGTASWSLSGVAPGAGYVVHVACTDPGGLTGSADGGPFDITPAPQQVSFSAQVVPIFTSTCTSAQCHDAVMPQNGLQLTAAEAFAELVGVPGKTCTSLDLVAPGSPNDSYLMIKLVGSGS